MSLHLYTGVTRLHERLDGLAHGVDAGLRALDGRLDRYVAQSARAFFSTHESHGHPNHTVFARTNCVSVTFVSMPLRPETLGCICLAECAVCVTCRRQKGGARATKAAARMAEARSVSLAAELGRVARHVGLDDVG